MTADRTLEVAGRVVAVLDARGLASALVGGAALAVHGYVRATADVDIGLAVTSLDELRALADELRARIGGAEVELRLPDAEDPLGGVIAVRAPDADAVELVNFVNPIGTGEHPGREAVERAPKLDVGSVRVGVVDVPHLVAMKLHAGRMQDKADVVELLARNADVDLGEVRALCARFGLEGALEALVPEIEAERA